jgi:hypothetical protein
VTQAATPAAGVVAGTKLFDVALPSRSYRRYLGVRAVIATNNVSAGAIHAGLVKDTPGNTHYPDAI